jgi:hypothetical protein
MRINLSVESFDKLQEYAERSEIPLDEAVYELASIGLLGFKAKTSLSGDSNPRFP